MVVALVVIGGGIAMMGRVGNAPSSGDEEASSAGGLKAPAGKYAEAPLVPTATFNVSEKLESGVNLITDIAVIADRLHAADSEPVDDLQTVEEIIQFHTRLFISVPGGGENVDIMRNLTGDNERNVALINPDHPAINDRGELVDRWGTPFHFHQISSRELEIRSAGPDGSLYTEDDILMEGDSAEEDPVES